MALQFVFGGAALGAGISRISILALGKLKQLAWATGWQLASYVAVDALTDYVIGDKEDSAAETALDIMISVYLDRKRARGFKAAQGMGQSVTKFTRAKKDQFLGSLGAVPWLDPRRLSKVGGVIERDAKVMANWAWSTSRDAAMLVGKRSGRVYGHISAKGISIPELNNIGGIRQFAAGAGAAWALDALTDTGLDVVAEQILDLNKEYLELDDRDVVNVSQLGDPENAKIDFIRDPDVFIPQFGGDQTPDDILIDRAISWFLNERNNRSMSVVEDDGHEIADLGPNSEENRAKLVGEKRLTEAEVITLKKMGGDSADADRIVLSRYAAGTLSAGSQAKYSYSVGAYNTSDVKEVSRGQASGAPGSAYARVADQPKLSSDGAGTGDQSDPLL